MTSDKGLYHVLIDKRAEKDIKRVPGHIVDKFAKIIDELEVDPINKRAGVDIKKLKGYQNTFRARIGDYRSDKPGRPQEQFL